MEDLNWLKDLTDLLKSVLRGKEDVIKMALVCLIGRGHLLIEDIPGVGKTTLALALARATDCSFQRIQFTSDLLPTDILGVNVFNPQDRTFEFRPGPIFANIVLADEINRTNPKTQSALLEAMNERRVSVEGKTYHLEEPFMVIATQNPVEYHGTFPLPESQLDRFMLHLKIGYPSYEDEKAMLRGTGTKEAVESIKPVVSKAQILRAQALAQEVYVDESLYDYLLQIVHKTRNHPEIRLGVSPRGTKFFLSAAKAHALVQGRDFLSPDDIKTVGPWVLGHRLLLKSRSFLRDAVEVVEQILQSVPVPV
ncbi:MAG: MoxR family ATPase [Nitrospirae bacterium]|nr:MAG: MoxR family ATPase [Nitrospirota bacterium]